MIRDFYMDAIGQDYDIAGFRRFLLSFTRATPTRRPNGPPTLMFIWPKRLTVVGRLVDVAFVDEQFSADGRTLVCNAQCTLHEVDEQASRRHEVQ